jgi:diaminopimelate decarboxylase
VHLRLLGSQRNIGGELFFGEASARDLAREFGTPLYVFDASDFRGKCREFLAAAPGSHISYASKANSSLAVLSLALEEGLDVDCASLGELEAALRVGFRPEQITLHGNNKSDEELRRAADIGLGRVVLDHLSEIGKLADLARGMRVMLRLAPGVDPETHEAISTGQEDTKFGFNIADGSAESAYREVMKRSSLRLIGYHCHVGSQLMNSHAHQAALHRVADFAVRMGSPVEEICAGGGLGVRYVAADQPESIATHCEAVRRGVEGAFRAAGTAVPRLGFEPGRALVGEAGTTLYKVGVRKQVGGRVYLSVDGGMADNPRPQLYGATYTAINASRMDEPHGAVFRVSGRHCETDTLISEAFLPSTTDEGDLIAIQTTGAYNFAMASNYNRYPRPAMVMVGDGTPYLAVERETLSDLFARERVRSKATP